MDLFKDIKGYEGIYQISECGKVYSLARTYVTGNGGVRVTEGKFLKNRLNNTGYPTVKISKNGFTKLVSVHRLVALTYIDNSLSLPQVNHIDGNKLNSHKSNLEWVTGKENVKHAHAMGLSSTIAAVKKTSIQVINKTTGQIFLSCEKAAVANGMGRRHLLNMLHGRYRNKTDLTFYNK